MFLVLAAAANTGVVFMNRKGFTFGECVTVAVTVGILCAVGLPAFSDYKSDASRTACKGALGAMRAAIANYHIRSQGEGGDAAAVYPTLAQIKSCGVVLADTVPENPFSAGSPRNGVVETSAKKGSLTGAGRGWCYDPATGEVWANTNTPDVGENGF